MSRPVKEVFDARALNDSSCVHGEHPVRELGRDGEIV
jgi:hypothetical protein